MTHPSDAGIGRRARQVMKGALLVGGVALVLARFGLEGSAHPGDYGVTWTGTVSPLLERRCGSCHGSGGARPQLDQYETARAAAQEIKQAVLTRRMPRWHAINGFGDFANDPRLTPREIDMVADWVDSGAPFGTPAPAPRRRSKRADAGVPDLLLQVPGKHLIRNTVETFELATGVHDDRWVRGWAFTPGNRALVRGAVMSLASGVTLGTWVRGESATFLPEGVASRLPAGATLRLTIYYEDPKGPAVDASGVGLYFSAPPVRELTRLSLPCGASPLTRDIEALAIRPSPGSAGRSLTALARRSDRSIEPVGSFSDYGADQPYTYWFRKPVLLRRGTSIDVSSAHGDCSMELDYVMPGQRATRSTAVESPADASLGRGEATGDGEGTLTYTCPMHPDIRAEAPGQCTICRMVLMPNRVRVEGAYELEAGLVRRGGTGRALRLVVREPGTETVVREFATVHERPFHLMLVSNDLREFAHVHPVSQPDGSLEVASPPIAAGAYQLYADFLPVEGTPQLIRKAIIANTASAFTPPRGAGLAPDLADKIDHGMRVRIEPEAGGLVAGKPTLIDFTFTDAEGHPLADLEPYLGAWGHLFIVSADLADAVHSHPITPLTDPGGPRVVFRQRFPRAGSYRLWAQFQRGGKLATVPFTVTVAEPR